MAAELPDKRKELFDRLQGPMLPADVALALGISKDTLRTLGIPRVRLTRSSVIYFPDEVVAWLRAQEREA